MKEKVQMQKMHKKAGDMVHLEGEDVVLENKRENGIRQSMLLRGRILVELEDKDKMGNMFELN